MSTIEEFLLESNFYELYALAETLGVAIRTGTGQKTKQILSRELASDLDARIVTHTNNIQILKDFILKGRIQAFGFTATNTPNNVNGLFQVNLDEHFDIIEHTNYTMYEPKRLFNIPKAIWFCKLKNEREDDNINKFIAFQKFQKKDTLRMQTISTELFSKFGMTFERPLLRTNIKEIFQKVKNESLEYIGSDFKVFYSSHISKDKLITSSTHLSSGNEKITKDLSLRDDEEIDDIDINYFIKNGEIVAEDDLLSYMVINAPQRIVDKLKEIKINLIKKTTNENYDRYKLLITPTIIHTYNIDTTIDDIILIISDLNNINTI